MNLIQRISSLPNQAHTLVLGDGSYAQLNLYYRPQQAGWFIEELAYGDFLLRGLRVVNSPNMLHQFRNRIPFGLACFSDANREPYLQQDFLSGASRLYLLSSEEVESFTEYLADV